MCTLLFYYYCHCWFRDDLMCCSPPRAIYFSQNLPVCPLALRRVHCIVTVTHLVPIPSPPDSTLLNVFFLPSQTHTVRVLLSRSMMKIALKNVEFNFIFEQFLLVARKRTRLHKDKFNGFRNTFIDGDSYFESVVCTYR